MTLALQALLLLACLARAAVYDAVIDRRTGNARDFSATDSPTPHVQDDPKFSIKLTCRIPNLNMNSPDYVSRRFNPALSALPSDEFIVMWTADLQDGDSYGVFSRIPSRDCRVVGPDTQVNIEWRDQQFTPAVAAHPAHPSGVVAFLTNNEHYNFPGSLYEGYFRFFDAKGNISSPEFCVGSDPNIELKNWPTASLYADGSFWLSWNALPFVGVMHYAARLFDKFGTPLTSEINVFPGIPSPVELTSNQAIITALPDGNAAVVGAFYQPRIVALAIIDRSGRQVNNYTIFDGFSTARPPSTILSQDPAVPRLAVFNDVRGAIPQQERHSLQIFDFHGNPTTPLLTPLVADVPEEIASGCAHPTLPIFSFVYQAYINGEIHGMHVVFDFMTGEMISEPESIATSDEEFNVGIVTKCAYDSNGNLFILVEKRLKTDVYVVYYEGVFYTLQAS